MKPDTSHHHAYDYREKTAHEAEFERLNAMVAHLMDMLCKAESIRAPSYIIPAESWGAQHDVEIRNKALEEAAVICDRGGYATECATEIRALKEPT